jgi:hypothetical protein
VIGFFKMKALLLGLLVASPALAAWICRGSELGVSHQEITSASHDSRPLRSESVVRVPVEVIAKGSPPKWVYVEVANHAVPEPGMVSLFALTTLLLVLRRQRG